MRHIYTRNTASLRSTPFDKLREPDTAPFDRPVLSLSKRSGNRARRSSKRSARRFAEPVEAP